MIVIVAYRMILLNMGRVIVMILRLIKLISLVTMVTWMMKMMLMKVMKRTADPNFLVPTYENEPDPNDIFALKWGKDHYFKYLPRLKRMPYT